MSFEVRRGAKAELKLYDVAGREVWKGHFNAGRHHVSMPLPTGVYILRSSAISKTKVSTYTDRLIILGNK